MVEIVQTPSLRAKLRETRFANERLDFIGVELLTLSELFTRIPANLLSNAERVQFFMVLVVTGGHGSHLIDLVRFPLEAGHVVIVRPGEVQHWQAQTDLQADVLLIDPAILQPDTTSFQQTTITLLRLEDWPSCFTMQYAEIASWKSLASMLIGELDQPQFDTVSAAMARELLLCMLLNLSRAVARHMPALSAQKQLLRRFFHELACVTGVRPSVALLARRLRVSPSTLNRACQDALGHSAKEEVDRRVALEAQRLLVHSTDSAAAIGEQLGFTEPTNFVKFFRRLVGATPESFRQSRRLSQ